MTDFFNALQKRHATKHFNTALTVDAKDIERKESVRLSPSSYNLMPCRVIEYDRKFATS